MSDKRTGKKKKKIRAPKTETPDSSQQAPVSVPKRTNTPPKK
jgi:hypothetical protein